jgi:hypothetical protein
MIWKIFEFWSEKITKMENIDEKDLSEWLKTGIVTKEMQKKYSLIGLAGFDETSEEITEIIKAEHEWQLNNSFLHRCVYTSSAFCKRDAPINELLEAEKQIARAHEITQTSYRKYVNLKKYVPDTIKDALGCPKEGRVNE